MEFELPQHIVVEGPIGVGKTTLAVALADRLDGRLLLEQFEENPFLPLFYEDQERYALQTELSFLISRFHQQESFVQGELFQKHTVSDYLFTKCALFASLTLESHELRLFEEVYSVLVASLPQPDLVINLQAPLDVLMSRISSRGRNYEREIKEDYMEQLIQLYHREFAIERAFPVISIDTTSIDFREQDNIDRLLHLIASQEFGRISSEQFMKAPTTSLILQERIAASV